MNQLYTSNTRRRGTPILVVTGVLIILLSAFTTCTSDAQCDGGACRATRTCSPDQGLGLLQ